MTYSMELEELAGKWLTTEANMGKELERWTYWPLDNNVDKNGNKLGTIVPL